MEEKRYAAFGKDGFCKFVDDLTDAQFAEIKDILERFGGTIVPLQEAFDMWADYMGEIQLCKDNFFTLEPITQERVLKSAWFTKTLVDEVENKK